MGAPRQPPPSFSPHYEPTVAAARAALGEAVFAAAMAEGQALSPEQAVAEALSPERAVTVVTV